jgi:Uma2 family endonuclease
MSLELPAGPLNYDEYAAISDGRRYEVIEGELVLSPSGTASHQRLVKRLLLALESCVSSQDLGEVFLAPLDVVLRADRPAIVVQPDVFFIEKARLGIVTEANVQGVPDLVVEVLSPSNARHDTIKKLALYAKHGVKEVWFVPLAFDRIETLVLLPEGQYDRPMLFLPGEKVTSPRLPGLDLSVDRLFEGL